MVGRSNGKDFGGYFMLKLIAYFLIFMLKLLKYVVIQTGHGHYIVHWFIQISISQCMSIVELWMLQTAFGQCIALCIAHPDCILAVYSPFRLHSGSVWPIQTTARAIVCSPPISVVDRSFYVRHLLLHQASTFNVETLNDETLNDVNTVQPSLHD